MRTLVLLCFVGSVTGCATNLSESLHPATAFSTTRATATNTAAEPSAQSRIVGGVNVDHFTNAPLQRLKKVRLAAPVETVFDYVGDHERMPEWIPLMHRVTMDHLESQNGPQTCGVGSVRTCEIRPDKIREKIVIWEPDQMFAYRVIDGQRGVPIDGGFGLITFEEQGPRNTVMTWRIYYEPKKWNPKAAVMPAMVNLQLNGGLKNLVKRFGGEVVVR